MIRLSKYSSIFFIYENISDDDYYCHQNPALPPPPPQKKKINKKTLMHTKKIRTIL